MKRHLQLQPLSRQHHNGLLMSLLLLKGLRRNADLQVLSDFILHGWNQELQSHFEAEEKILIPALKETNFEDSLIQQLLIEHTELRALVQKIENNAAGKEEISQFGTLLEKHIRFEERIFFPKAEEILSEEKLSGIGELLQHEDSVNCMNYPVKFWE